MLQKAPRQFAAFRLCVACLVTLPVLGCEPAQRPPTGIVQDPRAHAREVADVEASLARKRAQAEAEERQRVIDAEEAAEAERRRAAAHDRAERCAQERADRLTAIARIEDDAVKLKERTARRQIVEQWIAKNCRRLVQREYGTELVTGANGQVFKRRVVVNETPFEACPAKTPEDIARDGGLTYDDDDGWTRDHVPPIPQDPEEYKAAKIAALGPRHECD